MTPPRLSDDELQSAIESEFECARCGHCCKGDGLVHVGPAELDRAAEHLGLSRRQFVKQYATRVDDQQWILRDKMVPTPSRPGVRGKGEEKWCIFLEIMPDGLYGCTINEAKPDQCASFPRKWRNDDSLQTCVGLRALVAKLRREKGAAKVNAE
jgi:Fe-S-cluster containining protein